MIIFFIVGEFFESRNLSGQQAVKLEVIYSCFSENLRNNTGTGIK